MRDLLASRNGRFSLVGFCLAVALALTGVWYIARTHGVSLRSSEEADPYIRFVMEAYDSIAANYWIKPEEYGRFSMPDLPSIFALAIKKQDASLSLATSTRSATAALVGEALLAATSTEAKRQLTLTTVNLVLYNLPPIGRDSLLSQQQVTSLRQTVANVNPSSDLYKDVGVPQTASAADIDAAYVRKEQDLKHATTTTAKTELARAAYAKAVLTNSAERERYDAGKVEPSIFSRRFGSTLYLSFDKIAPTTLQEFGQAIDAASTTPGLDSLILDMRGNVGGALDFAKAFIGLFIGPNQYAYDLYHQGDTNPERTTTPRFDELARFTDIAILTNGQTQSTAELTTAAMKRLRLAHIVGTRTRGWGSVENTYPLAASIDPSVSYALLLVNSLTLRDDQEPIEQNGVVPDVDTSKAGWERSLPQVFTSPSLIVAIKDTVSRPPLR